MNELSFDAAQLGGTLMFGLGTPPGIELPGPGSLFQLLSCRADELGIALDLVYLSLRAVSLYVRLLEHLGQCGVLVYAVNDVAEDFLFPLGPTRVTPNEELTQQRVFLGHRCSSSKL